MKLKSLLLPGNYYLLFVTSYLLLISSIYADTPTAQFLLVGQGARAEALGQSVVSNCFDYTAAYWNPAATVFLHRPELGFDYTKDFTDRNSFVAFIYPYQKVAFGLSVISTELSMAGYDSFGNRISDSVIEKNFNMKLLFGWKVMEALSFGIGFGQTRMQLSESEAYTVNISLGSVFKSGRVSFALALANFGGRLQFDKSWESSEESQPKLMRAGMSVSLLKDGNMTISASYTNVFE